MIKAYLIIKEGLDSERIFPVKTRLTIGRARDNDILLSTPMASRRHAVVYIEDSRPLLEDLGSANGTFLNGDLVKKAVLRNGDILRIGQTLAHYFEGEEPSDSTYTDTNKFSKRRKRLGTYLVQAGVIDDDTLRKALKVQGWEHKRIGQILIEMEVADDEQIAKALASQLNIPLVRVNNVEIPEEIRSLVTERMVTSKLLMPVQLAGNKLLVAMVDPLDRDALQDLRFLTGMHIDMAITPQGDILEAIKINFPMEALERMLETGSSEDVEFC